MERTALATACTVTRIFNSWKASSHSSSPTKWYKASDSPEQWKLVETLVIATPSRYCFWNASQIQIYLCRQSARMDSDRQV